MVACEVAWLHKLLGDLGLHVDRQVVIYCDNFSSIQLAKNPVFHARTKHIEVHYHFIREKVLAGEIDLTYVRTEDQVAEIFTKVLGAKKHRQFRSMLGVMELELSLRGVLRCQAQLELTFMMCLSDRSTSTSALSDCSTFTSTDARATDLHHCFFGGLVVVRGRGCLQELKLSPPLSFQLDCKMLKVTDTSIS
jgi:hypothetical protein